MSALLACCPAAHRRGTALSRIKHRSITSFHVGRATAAEVADSGPARGVSPPPPLVPPPPLRLRARPANVSGTARFYPPARLYLAPHSAACRRCSSTLASALWAVLRAQLDCCGCCLDHCTSTIAKPRGATTGPRHGGLVSDIPYMYTAGSWHADSARPELHCPGTESARPHRGALERPARTARQPADLGWTSARNLQAMSAALVISRTLSRTDISPRTVRPTF